MSNKTKKELLTTFRGRNHFDGDDIVDLINSVFIKGNGLDTKKVNTSNEKKPDSGLAITLQGTDKELLTFYQNTKSTAPWKINLEGRGANSALNITKGKESKVYIHSNGKVGINLSSGMPQYDLDVNGFVGMAGRVGTFKKGKHPANGKWHEILECPKNDCCGFELVAYIFDDAHNRYGLTYSIALYAGGDKGGKITMKTQAGSRWLFGKRLNRIEFKWKSETDRQVLMMRSRTHFGFNDGKNKEIFFRTSKIWDKNFETGNITLARPRLSLK